MTPKNPQSRLVYFGGVIVTTLGGRRGSRGHFGFGPFKGSELLTLLLRGEILEDFALDGSNTWAYYGPTGHVA